jgi:hypothetical protein
VYIETGFGDFNGLQICNAVYGDGPWNVINPGTGGIVGEITMFGYVTGTLTTTTTTQRHGLHGEVFATSSSTSSSVTGVEGSLSCGGG